MCGRFTLKAPAEEIADLFGVQGMPDSWVPRFNIAPSQDVAVISNWSPDQVELMRWGLIPSWADNASEGNRHINARSETVSSRPMFRECFARRRCLVLADGFFEWKREGRSKTPMYIAMASARPFALAGVWNGWLSPEGELIRSCTILTCPTNEALATIHDRMPVVVEPRWWDDWLSEGMPESSILESIFRSFPAESLKSYPVSTLVNSPRHDEPACIEKCEPRGTLPMFPNL